MLKNKKIVPISYRSGIVYSYIFALIIKLLLNYMNKSLLKKFIKSDSGASLVLIAAFSTIVIAIAVTLTVVSSMIFSNAEKRSRQDQVYMLASSLFSRTEELILNEPDPSIGSTNKSCLDLESYFADSVPSDKKGIILDYSGFDSMPDSKVLISVKKNTDKVGNTFYTLSVRAEALGETYIKTEDYSGNALSGYERI